MTTKCYKVVFRELGEVYNEGFIIAKIKNGRIRKLEGLFTEDFLSCQISEREIMLQYYLKSPIFDIYELDFNLSISMEDFELPLNIKGEISEKFEDIEYYRAISFMTLAKITDTKKINEYQTEIERYRKTMLFEKS